MVSEKECQHMSAMQLVTDEIGWRSHLAADDRINLQFNTDEPEAVLAILAKQRTKRRATVEDWQRLFWTDAYIMLKNRESQLGVGFSDEDFRRFVLSPELVQQAAELENTLDDWKKIDLAPVALRALDYLPAQARIRARVWFVIKPKTNSFVYDSGTGANVFLYLDTRMTRRQLESTVAHELHHIGLFGISSNKVRYEDLPANVRMAANWMDAFGEGLAMLAAAGGPDIHPLADSGSDDRARWDQDMGNFDRDLKSLDKFFVDIIDHRLVGDDITKGGYGFFCVRGPWYTVGWEMAVVVQKQYGKATLIECMMDPRWLLVRYNDAIREVNSRSQVQRALWSQNLMSAIAPSTP